MIASAFDPKRTSKFLMNISSELKARLKICAFKEGRTASDLANEAIESLVEDYEKKQKEGK